MRSCLSYVSGSAANHGFQAPSELGADLVSSNALHPLLRDNVTADARHLYAA